MKTYDKMTQEIQTGDIVKYEAPNGNGFIEGEVEQIDSDGTLTAVWKGREWHEVSEGEVMEFYTPDWK